MQVTATLLRKNPDFYSLWNYRREMLLALFAERCGVPLAE